MKTYIVQTITQPNKNILDIANWTENIAHIKAKTAKEAHKQYIKKRTSKDTLPFIVIDCYPDN